MNEIVKIYKDNPVRIIQKDGETWFVAKDVCEILGLNNNRQSVATIPEDEKGVISSDTLGDSKVITNDISIPNRGLQIVNEPGLYRLVFRSRKPEAENFKHWVFHEVLPSIRKTGEYSCTGCTDSTEELLESTRRMLISVNDRMSNGENLPSHILKYAWNIANCSRVVAIPSTYTEEEEEIRAVFSVFSPGKHAKNDVYKSYCDNCNGRTPLSPGSFWPKARKCYSFAESRDSQGRFIIING